MEHTAHNAEQEISPLSALAPNYRKEHPARFRAVKKFSENGTTPSIPASLWRPARRHLNDLHVCKDLTDLHPDNGPDLKDIGQATGGEKLRHVYVYAALGIHIESRNKFKVLQ
jgi:hypothetical protein